MSELNPEIEGKYEILEKIQVGGMGTIYKVRHRLLGDVRVIKVLRPQLSSDVAFQKRFHREARAATRLIHPNIARLYDFAIDETDSENRGAAYIVMEYIEGWTLEDLVRRGELPPLGLALEIARQSLKAIGHLHAQGVIHRDISPDNLMLTRDVDGRPLVKLIDLGLVKSVAPSEELTASGVFVGKFRYAAPEHFQRDGGPSAGPASDLYSFGLVLYELLTGRYPIRGESATELIAGHLYHPPLGFAQSDPEGRLPEDLRQVTMRLLAKKPEERFGSAEELAAVLEPIAERYDAVTTEARSLLELTQQVEQAKGRRPPSRGSTQSRLDRQFGTGPTPPPSDRPTVSVWIARIESRIGESDFAAAREELRQAREAEGEVAGLVELEARVEETEHIFRTRKVETELKEVEDLRGAGRLEEALELARKLREEAPRHQLARLVVWELERALAGQPVPGRDRPEEAETDEVDEAALATTTPFAVQYSATTEPLDEAALAPTEILPTTKARHEVGADIRAQLETLPHREIPAGGEAPPPAPAPPREAPVAAPQRGFDEISLQFSTAIARETAPEPSMEPAGSPGASAWDLPLAPSTDSPGLGDEEPPSDLAFQEGVPTGSHSPWKGVVTALVLVLVFLGLGFVLARLDRGEKETVEKIEVEEIDPARLSRGELLIEATPWANVERIVDAAGRERPIPPGVRTPFTLELEVGTYRVTLYYPPENERKEVEVRVEVGQRARASSSF